MFRIRAIQVEHGDSLLISYGDDKQPRHLLVDGGPSESSDTLESVLNDVRRGQRLKLEVLVVTHYDLDHIQGVIKLLEKNPDWLDIQEIWFNGYHHLKPSDIMGSSEGDALSKLIRDRGLSWNASFRKDKNETEGGRILQSKQPITFSGGLEIRVLSPDEEGMAALAKDWRDPTSPPPDSESVPDDLMGRSDNWPPNKYAEYGGSAFVSDRSVPNKSSIALLLKFDNKRVLLGADAYSDVVEKGLKMQFESSVPIDLLKVSHHGSKGNTNKALLDLLECEKFLISTSGKNHKHPDHALIARLVARYDTPKIIFNYSADWPGSWQRSPANWPPYNTQYPNDGEAFVDVLL